MAVKDIYEACKIRFGFHSNRIVIFTFFLGEIKMFRRDDPTIFRKDEHIFIYNPPNVEREDYNPIRETFFDDYGRNVKAFDENSEFGQLLKKIM